MPDKREPEESIRVPDAPDVRTMIGDPLAEGRTKGGDIVDSSLPKGADPVQHLDGDQGGEASPDGAATPAEDGIGDMSKE
jgi:hypothetical protein